MDNFKIKGEVFIEKLHVDNKEVYDTIGPICNDVSWQSIAFLLLQKPSHSIRIPIKRPASGTQSDKWLMVWSAHNINQHITNWSIPIGTAGSEVIGSAIDMEIGYPNFTPKSLPGEKDYVTFVSVLAPVAGGRTIRSLGLQNAPTGSQTINVTNNSWYNTFTNLNLSVPCTQDESTLLQITYRLYLDDVVPSATISNISDGYYYYLRNLFKEMSDGTYTGINPITALDVTENITSSFYNLDNMETLIGSFLPYDDNSGIKTFDCGIGNNSITSQWFRYDGISQRLSKTKLLTDLNSMGTFFRYLRVSGSSGSINVINNRNLNLPFLYQRAIPANSSPITNVFKQTSSAVGPFQEINSISPMSGNLTFNTSGWTPTPFPKLVRLLITSSGDETTATYRFETLDFTGGFVQNSFCPREALIPQDGVNISEYSYHRKHPDEKIITEYVSQGGTTVRTVDNTKTFVAVNCQRTKDAISIYNIETGDKKTLSGTSTPSLPVTNTSDVTVSNGYIFVTCANTGLWQIDPTLTVVTHITTIGAGVDSSKAYQIDSKTNGDLWVLFDGGLAKGVTANSGATWTWTVYNPTSGTVFNAVGITDSKWANVSSMVIDKVHANDRIMFVTGTTTTSGTNASSFIWWEGSTGTTTVMTTGLGYPSFSLVENLKRSDVMQCINGYWISTISTIDGGSSYATMYKAQFGNLNWTTNTTASPMNIAGRVVPATIASIPGAFISSFAPYTSFGVRTSAFFVQGTNISSLPSTITTSTPQIEFFTKFGAIDTTTSDFRTFSSSYFLGTGYSPVLYFTESNMVVYYLYYNNSFTVAPLVIDPSITNYNTFKPACWKSYEWNGSNWVLGNTNSKTCHTSFDSLVDGITIRFNGALSTAFLNTHQFTFVIGDGVMKDNATTYTYNLTFSPSETEVITDFYTSTSGQVTTVPSYRYGLMTDEYVNFSKVDPEGENDRGVIQARGRISGREQINGAIRIADQTIPANTTFQFKFKLITASIANGAITTAYAIYLVNSSNTVQYVLDRDSSGNYAIKNSSNTVIAFIPRANLNITTDIIVERGNDNKIYFYYGSKLITTLPALAIQLHIRMTPSAGDAAPQSVIGYYDMKLTYQENRRLVKIGNLANSTGTFSPKFMGLTPSVAVNDAKITVNNIPRTIVNTVSYATISGVEVKIATGCGYVVFQDLPSVTYPSTGSPVTGPCLAPVVTAGVVTSIDIISSGSGFVTTPTLAISAPVAGGTTATATATLTATKSVSDFVTITNAGAGYTDGVYTLVFAGGGGANAAGTVTVSDGVVRRVNISNGGDSYTAIPTLSFVGAGTPTTAAVLTPTIGYRIASVTVTNGGSGYITDGNTPLVGYATAHYLP